MCSTHPVSLAFSLIDCANMLQNSRPINNIVRFFNYGVTNTQTKTAWMDINSTRRALTRSVADGRSIQSATATKLTHTYICDKAKEMQLAQAKHDRGRRYTCCCSLPLYMCRQSLLPELRRVSEQATVASNSGSTRRATALSVSSL